MVIIEELNSILLSGTLHMTTEAGKANLIQTEKYWIARLSNSRFTNIAFSVD